MTPPFTTKGFVGNVESLLIVNPIKLSSALIEESGSCCLFTRMHHASISCCRLLLDHHNFNPFGFVSSALIFQDSLVIVNCQNSDPGPANPKLCTLSVVKVRTTHAMKFSHGEKCMNQCFHAYTCSTAPPWEKNAAPPPVLSYGPDIFCA